jgi:hypothetical protein
MLLRISNWDCQLLCAVPVVAQSPDPEVKLPPQHKRMDRHVRFGAKFGLRRPWGQILTGVSWHCEYLRSLHIIRPTIRSFFVPSAEILAFRGNNAPSVPKTRLINQNTIKRQNKRLLDSPRTRMRAIAASQRTPFSSVDPTHCGEKGNICVASTLRLWPISKQHRPQ